MHSSLHGNPFCRLRDVRLLSDTNAHLILKFERVVVCVYAYVDLDECLSNNGGCHSERKCTNTAGSMKCEDCSAGWTNDGAKGCTGV